jgi:hypothetical protein
VDTLVVSFVSHTRVFRFEPDESVDELEAFGGFDMAEATLYAGNLRTKAVQVTSSAVLLTDDEGGMVSDSWRPPNGSSITAVVAEGDTVLVSLGGAALVVLSLQGGGIKVQVSLRPGEITLMRCKQHWNCIRIPSSLCLCWRPSCCTQLELALWDEKIYALTSSTGPEEVRHIIPGQLHRPIKIPIQCLRRWFLAG